MYAKSLATAAVVLFACLCLSSSGAPAAGLSASSEAIRSPYADSHLVSVWHRGHWRGGHWYWGPGVVIYPYPRGTYYDYYYYGGYRGPRPYVSPCYRRCRADHGPRYCYDLCER